MFITCFNWKQLKCVNKGIWHLNCRACNDQLGMCVRRTNKQGLNNGTVNEKVNGVVVLPFTSRTISWTSLQSVNAMPRSHYTIFLYVTMVTVKSAVNPRRVSVLDVGGFGQSDQSSFTRNKKTWIMATEGSLRNLSSYVRKHKKLSIWVLQVLLVIDYVTLQGTYISSVQFRCWKFDGHEKTMLKWRWVLSIYANTDIADYVFR